MVTAKPGSHTFQIHSQGTALPRSIIRLVSEVSGRVVSVSDKFDAGQVFKEEDVLLTIDSRDYELALAQAEATVAQADLRLQMEEKEAAVVRREWQLLNQGNQAGCRPASRNWRRPGLRWQPQRRQGGSPAQRRALRGARTV